jgi:phenylpropionate dioxygenase-like ring-hydroxylating dioxygenase large terminal subunit
MSSNYYTPVISVKSLLLNKPTRVWLNDIPIVLIKTQSKITAFEDFCPHRGLALSEGFFYDNQLHCKYHGWSFSIGSGENTFVPVKNNKVSCKLKPIHVIEKYEQIWLSTQPEALIPELTPDKAHIYITGKINAEMTHVLENFLEGSHTHYVHNGLVRTKNKKRHQINAKLIQTTSGFNVTYQSEPAKGLITKLLPKKYRSLKPVSTYLHSGVAILTYINHEQKEVARFEAILSNKEDHIHYSARVYLHIGPLGFLVKPFARFLFKRIIEQDRNILELQQQNLRLFNEKKFVTDETDMVGKYIYAWQNAKNNELPNEVTFNVYW